MLTKLQKWGNSQGLRLNKALLAEAHLNVGDEVKVSVEKGRILIEPTSKIRGRYDLKMLIVQMPKTYQPEELDWGQPTGKEEW